MASIAYNDIYSGFYLRVEAFDFLELDDNTAQDFLCSWLHAAMRPSYIRRLFSIITFDDDVMRFSYELKSPVEEMEDEDFVTELLVLGMCIEWLTPKLLSLNNIKQMFGSKEEKYYSQAQQIQEVSNLLKALKKERRRMICDRGYIYNAYVNGEDL